MLRKGTVGIGGSTGAVLGRSLMSLREVVDRALSEVRLTTGKQRSERLSVVAFLDEIAATGMLHSDTGRSSSKSSRSIPAWPSKETRSCSRRR